MFQFLQFLFTAYFFLLLPAVWREVGKDCVGVPRAWPHATGLLHQHAVTRTLFTILHEQKSRLGKQTKIGSRKKKRICNHWNYCRYCNCIFLQLVTMQLSCGRAGPTSMFFPLRERANLFPLLRKRHYINVLAFIVRPRRFALTRNVTTFFTPTTKKTEAIVYVSCALDLISSDQHIIIGSEYVSKERPGSYM